jgi:tetratricopeptide (TPR) repeat protein
MKATVQQEDLQVLGNILQERLVAQVLDSQDFQVKCAVKNDELMILTQHPNEVTVDTRQVFEVLEQALQWQFNYQTQRVQFFLRVSGEKRPYAQHFLDFQIPTVDTQKETEDDFPIPIVETEKKTEDDFPIPTVDKDRETVEIGKERDTLFMSFDHQEPSSPLTETEGETIMDSFLSSSEESFSDYALPDLNLSLDESEEIEDIEEKFDPFANIPDKPKKGPFSLSFPPLPIIIGTAVVIALVSGGGAFVLHRGCVISECKELQTAQQFKNDYQQQIKRTKSEKDLLAVQQKLDGVVAELQNIPQWSPRYQDSQLLVTSFSEQSTKINQVLKALQMASLAQKKTQAPPKSLDELRSRQNLWRQAITSLEVIKPSNELYGLVKINLPTYQNTLKSVNDQLLKEETWLQKIATAKTAGETATKLQINAKSAPEWQRVESNFQTAINTLKIIPINSLGFEDARKLLAEYQPQMIVASNRAKKEQLAAASYQQAIKAASQAKIYGNQNQWTGAVKAWEQAVQSSKQVSQDTFYFNQAKPLIETYTASLKQAQEQFQIYGDLTQTRAELKTTCTSTIKICTFTIENQEIKVNLTPEYDRLFQANNPKIQSHFQSLKDALKVISQNAKLPVFIYNAQGQERYMRQPQ